jgi:hypothetical protein
VAGVETIPGGGMRAAAGWQARAGQELFHRDATPDVANKGARPPLYFRAGKTDRRLPPRQGSLGEGPWLG